MKKARQKGPLVARRLAAGSSRRLPTHRQDRRSSEVLRIPGEEMPGKSARKGSSWKSLPSKGSGIDEGVLGSGAYFEPWTGQV